MTMMIAARVPVLIPRIDIDGEGPPRSAVVLRDISVDIEVVPEHRAPLALKVEGREVSGQLYANSEYRFREGNFYRRTGIRINSGGLEPFEELDRIAIRLGALSELTDNLYERLSNTGLAPFPSALPRVLSGEIAVDSATDEAVERLSRPNGLDDHDFDQGAFAAAEDLAKSQFKRACSKLVIINDEIWPLCEQPVVVVNDRDQPGFMRVFAGARPELTDDPDSRLDNLGPHWRSYPVSEISDAYRLAFDLYERTPGALTYPHPQTLGVKVLNSLAFAPKGMLSGMTGVSRTAPPAAIPETTAVSRHRTLDLWKRRVEPGAAALDRKERVLSPGPRPAEPAYTETLAEIEAKAVDIYDQPESRTAGLKVVLPRGVEAARIYRLAMELVPGPTQRRLAAIALFYEGMSVKAVAEASNVNRDTLLKWVDVFNNVDKFAFLPLRPGKEGRALQSVAVRKLVSPVSQAARFDAVALTLQGWRRDDVIAYTNADRARVKAWNVAFGTHGAKGLNPDSVLPKTFRTDGMVARQKRESVKRAIGRARAAGSAGIADFDTRITAFVTANGLADIEKAERDAPGPLEAAIFRWIAAKVSGQSGIGRETFVAPDEYRAAITAFQKGGIAAVSEGFRKTGLEMPWPAQIRKLADTFGNHPARGKLKAIAAYLEGKSLREAAASNFTSPRWFGYQFGNYKRYRDDAHMIFGIYGRGHRAFQVPTKPPLTSPMRTKESLDAFRSRKTANTYISQVFGVPTEIDAEYVDTLVATAMTAAQADLLRRIGKLVAAHTVSAVDEFAKDRTLARAFRDFILEGPVALIEDTSVLARYALPPETLDIAVDMASDPTFGFRSEARALVAISEGAYPPDAAADNGVSIAEIAEMAASFSDYAAEYRPEGPISGMAMAGASM